MQQIVILFSKCAHLYKEIQQRKCVSYRHNNDSLSFINLFICEYFWLSLLVCYYCCSQLMTMHSRVWVIYIHIYDSQCYSPNMSRDKKIDWTYCSFRTRCKIHHRQYPMHRVQNFENLGMMWIQWILLSFSPTIYFLFWGLDGPALNEHSFARTKFHDYFPFVM